MKKIAIAAIATAFLLFVVVSPAGAVFNVADSSPGVVNYVGLDVDTSGNALIHVNSVTPSRWVGIGSPFTVDVVIDEVDAADGLSGFDATLFYDQTKIQVTASNGNMLLAALAGATIVSTGDGVPDSDGAFVISLRDTGINHETGEGVIVRLTLSCTAAGTTLLNLDAPTHASTKGAPIRGTGTAIPVNQDGQATIYCGYSPGFAPTTTVKTCNAMSAAFPDVDIAGNTACADVLTTGTASNVTMGVNFPSGGYTPANIITFSPDATTITPGDTMVPGVKFGGLRTASTFGVGNAACTTAFTVDTVLYNVALPNNPPDPRTSTNIVYPRPAGSTDRFGGWQVGSEPPALGGTTPGTPPMADGTSIAIQNYPSYLLDAFDPDFVPGAGDGPALPLRPLAVYGGLTNILGTWLPLYLVQFDNSGPNVLSAIPAYTSLIDPAMGQPSVNVIGDPTAGAPAASTPISDLCTPLDVTAMLLGRDPTNTYSRAVSPTSAGTQFIVQYIASQRDTDQDGIENTIDTCLVTLNGGSPRAGTGDTDGDGIDDACDLLTLAGSDVDGDAYANRLDNCPQFANASQTETETAPAADNGPGADAMGDACDSENGTITVIQNRSSGSEVVSITPSDAVANGRYQVRANYVAKCFGATDADGDGYCSTQDAGGDSGACSGTVPPSCTVRHSAWSGASHPLLQVDSDGDGFSDAFETYLGTDGAHSCAMTPVPPGIVGGVNDETIDNWPLDFNDDRQVSLTDVTTFSSRFGKAVNASPATPRWDLTGDGLVSLPDITKMSAPFGLRCGQDVGMPAAFSQQ